MQSGEEVAQAGADAALRWRAVRHDYLRVFLLFSIVIFVGLSLVTVRAGK